MSREGGVNGIKAHLSLWDTISIIIGIVIGAGIYETAPLIFQNVSTPWAALGVWVVGGALSLVGALCYAELATTYPRSGGDYVYLTRAYGSWAGFLFGWAQLAVLMTGSIGMMAYIFANYATRLWDFGGASEYVYATGAVVLLSATNVLGMIVGKQTQNFLTSMKVLGLGVILVAGFFWAQPGVVTAAPSSATVQAGSLGLAMILVLYTYGGWNDAAFVAAEVHDKSRNIPRALIFGTLLLTLIYVLVNGAYLLGMGFEGARASRAIAADVLQRPFGEFGSRAMSVLVMISALGAINGLIYTGSRIYATLGEDYRMFARLAQWHPKRSSPVSSLLAQAVITLFLITLLGTAVGRGAINIVLRSMGFDGVSWDGHGGFDTLLRCTAPLFWLFFLMTGVSLFILRMKDRSRPRPFTVPLYPVLPLVFCGMCIYMLYSATVYAGKLLIIGVFPLALGVLLYWFSVRNSTRLQNVPGSFSAQKTDPADERKIP